MQQNNYQSRSLCAIYSDKPGANHEGFWLNAPPLLLRSPYISDLSQLVRSKQECWFSLQPEGRPRGFRWSKQMSLLILGYFRYCFGLEEGKNFVRLVQEFWVFTCVRMRISTTQSCLEETKYHPFNLAWLTLSEVSLERKTSHSLTHVCH